MAGQRMQHAALHVLSVRFLLLGISGPGQEWDKGDLGVVGDVGDGGDGAPEGRMKSVVAEVGVAIGVPEVPELVLVVVDWAVIVETNRRATATAPSILGFTMT